MITTHTQLLNALIEKYNLRSYLEVGVQNPTNNFDLIKTRFKEGVDPCPVIDAKDIAQYSSICFMTSDDFFASPKIARYDLIFIDGFHHADQVKRDFDNSLACLSDNGFILIHDVLPENEVTTCVPRGSQKIWHGDVYKFAMNIGSYDGIKFKTFNIDEGCLLIWKDKEAEGNGTYGTDWEIYKLLRDEAMNVTDTVEI